MARSEGCEHLGWKYGREQRAAEHGELSYSKSKGKPSSVLTPGFVCSSHQKPGCGTATEEKAIFGMIRVMPEIMRGDHPDPFCFYNLRAASYIS